MKIQTNAGEVELTADMVRPGMVFRVESRATKPVCVCQPGPPRSIAGRDGGIHVPPAGVLTIGDGVEAISFQCASAVLFVGRRRRAAIEIRIDASAECRAVDTLMRWLELGRDGTLAAHGEALRMTPTQWETDEGFSRPGTRVAVTRVAVTLEEAVEEERPRTPIGFNPPGTYHCLGCDENVAHGTPHNCAAEQLREERRRAEAPLVALVNACPEGLDPRGWQAAVLAAAEGAELDTDAPGKRLAAFLRIFVTELGRGMSQARAIEDATAAMDESHVSTVDGYREWVATVVRQRCETYVRALQPTTQPVPFRRRSPGLPCDDGRDG